MSQGLHALAREVFLVARDLADENRQKYLLEACNGDQDLLAEVESLLAHHDAEGRNESSEQGLGSLLDMSATPLFRQLETPPETIGRYRILGLLGEGGMGEVFLAEQGEPLRRRVAIKIVKWGMNTKDVLARFDTERQALALMDHPSIAQVFDAGATPEGRPYFAMEYVPGMPITEYCDGNRLGIEERLRLMIHVCLGVQHAHQKGVIHRDLKASNVMVMESDGKPLPKIIDFGVAKATSHRLTAQTVYTELGQWIGTPEYMSPEQAQVTGMDIDTRTDVYSLGVLLYELLVGMLPFASKELREAGFDEMRRMIREEEPTRPSTKVSNMGGKATAVARDRRVDLATLSKELEGDLDWIVMKALEKDRTRRYGSPAELAEDIQRHLRHEPVLASPPSTLYRAGKFVRRHRVGVAAWLLVMMALVGGIAGTSIGLLRAKQEARSAQEVAVFLADMLSDLNPEIARGRALNSEEMLGRAVERIDLELEDQPLVQARLLLSVGAAYEGLGLNNQALQAFDRSIRLRRRALGEDNLDYALSISYLGDLLRQMGDFEKSRILHEEALAVRMRLLGPEHPTVGWSLRSLGVAHWRLGNYEQAQDHLERSRQVLEVSYGPDHQNVATTLFNQAGLAVDMGDLEKARTDYEECLAIREARLGPGHPELGNALMGYGDFLSRSGDREAALETLARAVDVLEASLGPNHASVAEGLRRKGVVLQELNQLDAARECYERGLRIALPLVPANHPEVAATYYDLSRIAARQQRPEDALEYLKEALDRGWADPGIAAEEDFSDLLGNPRFVRMVRELEPEPETN